MITPAHIRDPLGTGNLCGAKGTSIVYDALLEEVTAGDVNHPGGGEWCAGCLALVFVDAAGVVHAHRTREPSTFERLHQSIALAHDSLELVIRMSPDLAPTSNVGLGVLLKTCNSIRENIDIIEAKLTAEQRIRAAQRASA